MFIPHFGRQTARWLLIRVRTQRRSHANLLFPLLTVAADAGDAAEDPGPDAHSEGGVLTRDALLPLCRTLTASGGLAEASALVRSVKVFCLRLFAGAHRVALFDLRSGMMVYKYDIKHTFLVQVFILAVFIMHSYCTNLIVYITLVCHGAVFHL